MVWPGKPGTSKAVQMRVVVWRSGYRVGVKEVKWWHVQIFDQSYDGSVAWQVKSELEKINQQIFSLGN